MTVDRITRNDIRSLGQETGGLRLSLYLPMIRAGQQTRQNSIRVSNALAEVKRQLLDRGVLDDHLASIVGPLQRQLADRLFLQHQEDGLAAFMDLSRPESFACYRLPCTLQEKLVIAPYFHLVPLLSVVQEAEPFFVLALSMRRVRLFEASRFGIDEISIGDAPCLEDRDCDIVEALDIDELNRGDRKLQRSPTRSITGVPGGERGNIMMGSRGGAEVSGKKALLAPYMRRVVEAIKPIVQDRDQPIVLLGVDYIVASFKDVSPYRLLTDATLYGNYDDRPAHEIHAIVWPHMRQHFEQGLQASLSLVQDKQQAGLASADVSEMELAAEAGRLEKLFIKIAPAGEQGGKDKDNNMIDRLVGLTLQRGGDVVVCSAQQPGRMDAAALFRYPQAS